MNTNETLKVPNLEFDETGKLVITASNTSSKHDFDFYIGKWKLLNRKLKKRLENSDEWMEFEATQEMYPILNGIGNIDNFLATIDDTPFKGMTVRLFNPTTKLWTLYWADSNQGVLQPGVTGSFKDKVAHFFSEDIYNDKKIHVVFRWDARDVENPIWSQAFSIDKGKIGNGTGTCILVKQSNNYTFITKIL